MTTKYEWLEREEVQDMSDVEKAALYYLIEERGYSFDKALDEMDNVQIYDGCLFDAATELFDEIYLSEIPEKLQYYIDYQRFATDCRISGDMGEFMFLDNFFTCTNANEF
jgi:hypothetical protein